MIDFSKHFWADNIVSGSEYLRQDSRVQTHPKVRWVAALVSLFCITSLFSLNVSAQPQPKKVLIVTGTNLSSPGFSVLQNIIAGASEASPNRVEFLFELQNGFLQPPVSPDDDTKLIRYLREKYADVKIDLIIVLVATRLGEVLKLDPELFKNVPRIIYDFEDDRDRLLNDLGPNTTGVWTKLAVAHTWSLAHTLQPDARQVVVIAGSSIPEKAMLERARVVLRSYENYAKFTYLTNVTMAELKENVASFSKDDVIIFLTFNIDRENNGYTSLEVLNAIAPLSQAPIYGVSETQLGSGIVGGSLVDFQEIGVRLSKLMLRVLAGEKAENISSENVPNVQKFDWRQLRRFGIDERNLPANSIVQFREPTFWESYKWYIIGVVAALIVQSLLIAWLLFLRARRRQAEVENARLHRLTEAEHQRLGDIVSNVPGIVWEIRSDPGTEQPKATFISDRLQEMLGYTPEEWLRQPPDFGFQIMLEEDQEKVKRDGEAVFSSGKDGFSEFRWTAKDGRTVWVESYLSPILEADGRVAGVRGVTLDVSGRKQTEESLRRTEERNTAIVSAIPDLIFVQNADGVYLDCHAKNAADMLMPEEIWGKNMRDVLPPRLASDFFQSFQLASQDPGPQILEYKLDLNNQCKWFEARTVRTGENFLSVIRDITKRKESERALQQAHDELSRLKNQLEAENIYLQEELQKDYIFGEIIGQSQEIKYVTFKINQVAQTDAPVLITGETGTGKELVARAIHGASRRKDRPLIKVNCAALSPTLIESELFGHEKGAFTGAGSLKLGRFELANHGTLLLDEIGELPMDLQVKLLRVLQEGELERVGGTKTMKIDVRIIAATNRDLEIEIEHGRFRQDLWYRLDVFPITTPPLRKRIDDVPILIDHFVKTFATRFGKEISGVSQNSMKALSDYSWPGNVRELANVIERAVISCNGPILRVQDNFESCEGEGLAARVKTLADVERDYIIRVLEARNWRINGPKGAALLLGMNPSTLRTRMAKLGIHNPRNDFIK